jgi:cell division protein FtsB
VTAPTRKASPKKAPTRGRPRGTGTSARNRTSARSEGGARGAARRLPERTARGYARLQARGLTFTTRAALLALVLCAVVLTLAYPAREYLAQHRAISDLSAQVSRDKASLAAMKVAGARASDPTYVEQQARLRLHMQRYGDQVFQLTPPPPVKLGKQTVGSVRTPVLANRSTQPWYSQLYQSTVESGK